MLPPEPVLIGAVIGVLITMQASAVALSRGVVIAYKIRATHDSRSLSVVVEQGQSASVPCQGNEMPPAVRQRHGNMSLRHHQCNRVHVSGRYSRGLSIRQDNDLGALVAFHFDLGQSTNTYHRPFSSA